MRILIFGDSITWGAWDAGGGWVDRLKRGFNKKYQDAYSLDNPDQHQIFNMGIGGNTSRDLLARFEPEYLVRHSPSWPPLFVIAIGVNDVKVPVGGQANIVPIDEYHANLRAIVRLAQKYSDKILLVGLFPLRDEALPFKKVVFSQGDVKRYDGVIDEVCKEFSIPKVELFHEVIRQENVQSLFFEDGLHPNDAGHQLIYGQVKPALDKLLEDEVIKK